MNKLYSKIATLSVSLAMAVGVGVAVGSKGAVKEAKAAENVMVFDFEDPDAHRTSGSNSYSSNEYEENGVTINLTYADSITTGTPLSGAANVCARVAKSTTNSPSIVIGPMNLSSYNISNVNYKVKGVGAMSATAQYSLNGTSWTNFADSYNLGPVATKSHDVTINEPASLYFKLSISVSSSTSSNRDAQFDDLIIVGTSTSTSHLTSISCANQNVEVASSVGLANAIVFNPSDAMNKNVSYSVKNGSDKISLNTSTGEVTGTKGGSAVVTITPEDTEGGATAIDVTITVTPLPSPSLTVGSQYVIYAVDATNGSYELTGVSNNLGTAASFTGTVPSSSYPLTVVNGQYENTIAFYDGSKYLALTVADNKLNQEDELSINSSWIVSHDEEGDAEIIKSVAFPLRTLQFNYASGNPRFACYGAGGQTAVKVHQYSAKTLEDFSIDSEINVYRTGSKQIEVTYDPADATDKDLAWESANPAVATVDTDGTVTGVAVGTTTVTASKTINAVLVERTCTVHVLNNQSAHRGTESDPFNVEDAVNVAKGILTEDPDGTAINLANEYYVKGLITAATTRTPTNLTLVIGDNEEQTSTALGGFTIFKAGKVYGTALATKYSSDSEVKADFDVGYYVKAKGTLVFYNETTPETTQGSADIVWCNRIEATTYAGIFLTGDCAATRTNWSSLATSFAALSAEAKALYASVEHKSPDKYTDEVTVEHAAARYDVVLEAYGTSQYTDFMGRVASGALDLSSQFELSNGNNVGMVIIIAASTASLIGFGLLLILKKRKVQK